MTEAPYLDAVREWMNGGDLSAEIEWPAPHWPDPLSWSNYAERLAACVRLAASGAPAFDGIAFTVEDTRNGRVLPHPRSPARRPS